MKKEIEKGYIKLAFAIIEQAVNDLKSLQKLGLIISDGKIIYWPTRGKKRVKFTTDYQYEHQVNELIHFFTGGTFEELLNLTNSDIDYDAAIAKLDIK
jgi:hypothetical protein